MKQPRAILALALAAVAPLSAADDFASADFSLRFPAAFAHFSPFADVAAKGGASAASRFGSSFNLAGIAWSLQESPFNEVASAEYSNLGFDAGTDLHVAAQTFAFRAGDAGFLRVSLGEITSDSEATRLGPEYEFDLFGARLDWSKRSDAWGFGAGVGFTTADTVFSTPALSLSDSEKNTWSFRAGVQREITDKWLIGVAADYANGDTDGTFARPTALGIVSGTTNYTTQQWIVQPGVAYVISKAALVHLDYQFAWFDNDSGDLTLHRWATGLDIPLADWCNLRAGTALDHHGNVAWTAGIGVFTQRASLNLAYQNDMFPELRNEFGRAHTLAASVSYKW